MKAFSRSKRLECSREKVFLKKKKIIVNVVATVGTVLDQDPGEPNHADAHESGPRKNKAKKLYKLRFSSVVGGGQFGLFFKYYIQHYFICRPPNVSYSVAVLWNRNRRNRNFLTSGTGTRTVTW
jgi:hypothetical protein